MLGVSGLLGNSGDGAAAAEARESGGGSGSGGEVGGVGPDAGGFSEEDQKVKIEEGERNSGGNRWPRQETLALLKIRSDMDVAFRDSSLKGPLWEEVSRKLAELGYHRSAKKCKEKFENVYKYHKRTKDGRSSKPDGKTYRFFDQLQALENHPSLPLLPPPQLPQTAVAATTTVAAVAMPGTNPPIVSQGTVLSPINPINVFQNTVTPTLNPTNPSPPPPPPPQPPTIQTSHPNMSVNLMSNSTSSSTSSDEDLERRHTRKRKWKGFFERLMKEVIEKQEELQKKFLETLEKRERDRMVREEAWRVQEMARMNREHELLVQERSIAAAKDAAVIAFLQKISEQQNPNVAAQLQMQMPVQENPLPPPVMPPPPPPPPPVIQIPPPPPPTKKLDNPKTDNGGEKFIPNSSRWPKAEVEALIRLRTNLDLKYQENGPKGPLWEEMSAAMRKLGYNRNAKRCKEKWENINKYFKKVD
uniref:Putative trihelix transcription factor GT-2-like n=1 Tax=Davidia involucrata TaxID=16924 RepID=A0A5B6ZYX8_DAVIN